MQNRVTSRITAALPLPFESGDSEYGRAHQRSGMGMTAGRRRTADPWALLVLLLALAAAVAATCADDRGYSYDFDGSTWLRIGDTSVFRWAGTAAHTMEFWFRADSPATSNMHIFDCWDRKTPDSGWYVRFNGGNAQYYRYYSSGSLLTSTTAIAVNTWQHLAVSYDGFTMRIYLDGVERGTLSSGSLTSNGERINIGCSRYGNAEENYFLGEMDEIRFWDVARTETQISQARTCLSTGGETGLVVYWQLNSQSWTDLSPSGIDPSVKVAGTWVTPSGAGVCGSCAGCDGVEFSGTTYDCIGVCNGSNDYDCAGVCGGSNDYDCTGVCAGTATYDCLGTCQGLAIIGCGGECGLDPRLPTAPSECGVASGLDVVAGDLTPVIVQARDASGDNQTTVFDNFTAAAVAGPGALSVSSFSALGEGLYSFSCSSTLSGTYQVGIWLNGTCDETPMAPGTAIAGSPFSLTVKPAATDAASCVPYGAALSSATAGWPSTFSIQARDEFENNVTLGGDTFDAQFSGPQGVVVGASSQYDAAGVSHVTYNLTVAGPYQLDVTLGGVHVVGSPFSLDVAHRATSAAHRCVAFGGGLSSAEAGVTAEFWIQSCDVFGNNRTVGVSDVFEVQMSGPETLVVSSALVANGISVVSYNATICGVYTVAVTLAGSPIAGSPFSMTLDPHSLSSSRECIPSGAGLSGSVAGVWGSFFVQARDVFQNNRTVNDDTFLADLVSGSITLPTVSSVPVANGIAEILYNATVAGTYQMDVTLSGGGPVAISPFTVVVAPQPVTDPRTCVLHGEGLSVATAGVTATFWIQARDAFENNRTANDDDFVVALTDPATVAGTSSHDGVQRYWAEYNATVSGTYTMTVTLGGAHVLHSPFVVTVAPQPRSHAPLCVMWGAGLVGATAGASADIWIQPRDAFGNNRTANNDTFTLELASASATLAVTSTPLSAGAGGQSLLQYNATVAGTYTATVSLENISILGSPHSGIAILPAPTSARESYVTGYGIRDFPCNQIASLGIHARDVFRNDRGVGSDPFTVNITGPDLHYDVSVEDYGDGHYGANYNLTIVGDYGVAVQLNGVHVIGSPFSMAALGPANITSVTPDRGPYDGGTTITIRGDNYADTIMQKCRFRIVGNTTVITLGTYVSRTEMHCTSLPYPDPALKFNATVSVANDNATFSAEHPYYYSKLPTLTSISPNEGPIFGGFLVTFTGTEFVDSPFLQCRFGDSEGSGAAWISATSMTCIAPARPIGVVTASVSCNSQQYSVASVTFRYNEPFSPYCRLPITTELPLAVKSRVDGEWQYHMNLARDNGTVVWTSPANSGTSERPDLLNDGDLCCLKTALTNGLKCGVAFVQNDTHLVYATAKLRHEAFVNEVITSWNDPCRNEPKEIFIEGYDYGTGQWVSIGRRNLDNKLGVKKACFVIPSDRSEASVCPDFFPDFRTDLVRVAVTMRSTASESRTSLPPTSTDRTVTPSIRTVAVDGYDVAPCALTRRRVTGPTAMAKSAVPLRRAVPGAENASV